MHHLRGIAGAGLYVGSRILTNDFENGLCVNVPVESGNRPSCAQPMPQPSAADPHISGGTVSQALQPVMALTMTTQPNTEKGRLGDMSLGGREAW